MNTKLAQINITKLHLEYTVRGGVTTIVVICGHFFLFLFLFWVTKLSMSK